MREFNSIFDKGFTVGLRRSSRDVRNAQQLVVCHNCKVGQGGLEKFDGITDSFTLSVPLVWPLPQLVKTSIGMFLISYSKVYEVESNLSLTEVLSGLDSSSVWHVADMGEYQVWTDGTTIVEGAYNKTEDEFEFDINSFDGDTVNTVCNFRGQLVIGGIGGNSTFGSNVVVYSQIGHADLSTILTAYGSAPSAGFIPMPWDGTIYCIKPLGKGVMVYGDKGIVYLAAIIEPTVGFSVNKIADFGVYGRGAVCGDDKMHVFLDQNGRLWRIYADMKSELLGYEEYMSFDDEEVVMLYDSYNGDCYIADGSICYLLTSSGLSSVSDIPTSVEMYDGGLIGPKTVSDDAYFMAKTDRIDFGNRGIKTITGIEVGGVSTNLTVSIDYLYNTGSTFSSSVFKTVSGGGYAAPIVSGTDFRICIKSSTISDVYINYINIKWKQSDKRYIRGVYEVKTDTTSA